jgi:hypothetical protein
MGIKGRLVLNTTHPGPEKALSDGASALPLDEVGPLMAALRTISSHVLFVSSRLGDRRHARRPAMIAIGIANSDGARQ